MPITTGRVTFSKSPQVSTVTCNAGHTSAKKAAPNSIPRIARIACYLPSPTAPIEVPGQQPMTARPYRRNSFHFETSVQYRYNKSSEKSSERPCYFHKNLGKETACFSRQRNCLPPNFSLDICI